AGAGVVEGVANYALDAFAGVDVFLDGDLVRGAFFEEAANASVQAFRILADDHEVDVGGGAVAERSEARVEEFGGASVDVEIELEAQAEEDFRGMLVGGDAGIAESAKEDGVEFVAQHLDGAIGERDVFAKVFVGAPIELDELERAVAFGGGGADDLDGDGGHFPADAVGGNDGDAGIGAAIAERDVGHGWARREEFKVER